MEYRVFKPDNPSEVFVLRIDADGSEKVLPVEDQDDQVGNEADEVKEEPMEQIEETLEQQEEEEEIKEEKEQE